VALDKDYFNKELIRLIFLLRALKLEEPMNTEYVVQR